MLALVVVVLHLDIVETRIRTLCSRRAGVLRSKSQQVAREDKVTHWRVAPPPRNIEDALKAHYLIAIKLDGWKWARGQLIQEYGLEHRHRARHN